MLENSAQNLIPGSFILPSPMGSRDTSGDPAFGARLPVAQESLAVTANWSWFLSGGADGQV